VHFENKGEEAKKIPWGNRFTERDSSGGVRGSDRVRGDATEERGSVLEETRMRYEEEMLMAQGVCVGRSQPWWCPTTQKGRQSVWRPSVHRGTTHRSTWNQKGASLDGAELHT
jgi:hypothetical protein